MPPFRFMTLDLRAPLMYARTGQSPWAPLADGERLAAFDLPPEWQGSIEPPADSWPEEASFVGALVDGKGEAADQVRLDRGLYFFVQLEKGSSGEIDRELIRQAAFELHKEGLWQGKKMKGRLYLRVLSEEGGLVCQLLRPIEAQARG